MKKLVLLAALMNCGLAFGFTGMTVPGDEANGAQSAAGASAAVRDEEQPVVLVEAWRRDRALDAFLRGDFATAEVEFGKNLQCIRRNTLQFENALYQGNIDTYRASFPGGNQPAIHNLPLRPEQIRERTCHSKEWQLYMIGLSQIQLGRFAEAKKSLSTVASRSKDDYLYDAHYRVGLLELMEGDVDGASRQLTQLTSLNRSCQKRGDNCEVNADLEVATAYLTRAVAAARQGTAR